MSDIELCCIMEGNVHFRIQLSWNMEDATWVMLLTADISVCCVIPRAGSLLLCMQKLVPSAQGMAWLNWRWSKVKAGSADHNMHESCIVSSHVNVALKGFFTSLWDFQFTTHHISLYSKFYYMADIFVGSLHFS